MRVSIIDLGGTFSATALGFHALGHEVTYFHRGKVPTCVKVRISVETEEPNLDADLVICSASFSDEIWALQADQNRDAPVYPDDPARATVNPEQRYYRDRWLDDRLSRLDEFVMVDMSDMVEPHDPFFFDRGTAHFKRELKVEGFGVHRFPFLYSTVLLDVEFLNQLPSHIVLLDKRANSPEVLFAGTVSHWRYGGKRVAEIESFRNRFPNLPLRLIEGGMTVGKVWKALQNARGSLYLSGRGKVCFRLHEVAALGIPTVASPSALEGLPAAWQRALPTDVDEIRSPVEMLEFYHKHYHPMRSAEWILERMGREACVVDPLQSYA